MNINFDSNKGKKKNKSGMLAGNYETMLKQRKEMQSEIEATIQEALADYAGESITIVIQKEDENGMPDHCHLVMAGTSRMESQVAMAAALSRASDQAMEILMDNVKGDVKAMLALASAVVNTKENN